MFHLDLICMSRKTGNFIEITFGFDLVYDHQHNLKKPIFQYFLNLYRKLFSQLHIYSYFNCNSDDFQTENFQKYAIVARPSMRKWKSILLDTLTDDVWTPLPTCSANLKKTKYRPIFYLTNTNVGYNCAVTHQGSYNH